jgi:NAD(P)-dependent dehydrogenase (short-subunit alcohol dehydrogenase family)
MSPAPTTVTRIEMIIVLVDQLPESDDRVAVVTGGGSGIGAAAARLFAEGGFAVAVVGRRRKPLETVAADVERAGREALVVAADLSDSGAPASVVAVVGERFGRIDVLVNNAASFALKPFGEFSVAEFDGHVAVNVRAAYFLVHEALPYLRAAAAPAVVNVSSAAAVMYRPRQSVYGLTKAAVEHLTKQLAAELAPDGIRVNAVRPGPTDTPIHRRAGAHAEARLAELGRLTPLGRVGRPEEVAWWVVQLADEHAAWVTGAIFTVDGGRVLGPPGDV